MSASELSDFREEVRTWLEENAPRDPRPEDGPEARAWDSEWQRRQYDGGWAGIDWPVEYGGRGLSLLEQIVWSEEYVAAGVPIGRNCFLVALAHAGPTIALRGNDEQKERYLAPILRGETPWCQGFSEPEAGSDLAGVRTRGEVDGDHLVVNGQKVWTSYGHLADYQELLVCTDPGGARHKNLTWVVCDMRSPGIDIRPIRTINGSTHFCEVFYDDVRIPIENVVDGIDNGWSVAMSTLNIERGPAALDFQLHTIRLVDQLVELVDERGLRGHDEIAQRLATVRAEAAAMRSMTVVGVSQEHVGRPHPLLATTTRAHWVDLRQRVARLAMDVLGPDAAEAGRWTELWLFEFAATIAGGTKDIQRNIIGERLLGLPR